MTENSREKTFSVVWDNNRYDNHIDMTRLHEEYTLIWLDNQYTDFNHQIISALRCIISHIELMKCTDTCIEYISSINKDTQQIFLVICCTLPKIDINELLGKVSELDGFVYLWHSQNKLNIDNCIRGSFFDQEELIMKITTDFQNVKGNKFNGISTCNFDVNRIKYKCFQLLMKVLQQTPFPRDMAKENMIQYCERNSEINCDKIEEFRCQYEGHNAITWYSSQSFFKKIFDRDLRSSDFNLISNFSFYLNDLYNALDEKFKTSSNKTGEFIVYRGITLPRYELEELKENVGCFIANNTFVSTTCKRDTALLYALKNNDKSSNQSVLFEIHISNKNIQRPFADISDISRIDGEILLSVGTVFRIDSVCEPESNTTDMKIWSISLTVCEKEPPELDNYFEIIVLRLVEILRRMSPDTDRVNSKLLARCRLAYSHDPIELQKIDDFEKNYTTDQAFRWYTKDSFLFRLLNAAFRQKDLRTIIDFRFFILDLDDQLTKYQIEYLQTLPKDATQQMKLYRGQLMSKVELNKLKTSIGRYISINSFFSTSTNENVALMYSGYGLQQTSSSFESVLFVINGNLRQIADISKSVQRALFVSMDRFSIYRDEGEILLSNKNIFRLNGIEKRTDYPVWSIYMTLCIDDQYLDNVHQYLDTILSPIIHLDLNNANSTFSCNDVLLFDNRRKREN